MIKNQLNFNEKDPNNNFENKQQIENVEQKQEPENNFEFRWKNLGVEKIDIEDYGKVTFEIGHLIIDGLQTLINEYGNSAVFDMIKQEKNNNKDFSMFNVIKKLEPDMKKRSNLFNKINEDLKEKTEKINVEAEIEQNDFGKHEYLYSLLGNKDAILRKSEWTTSNMKKLDTTIGKIIPQDKYFKTENIHAQRFGNYLRRDEAEELKNELIAANNDIFQLIEERDKNRILRSKKLNQATNELNEEIKKEIKNITEQLYNEYEEWLLKHKKDLSTLENFECSTDEMKKTIQEVLKKSKLEESEYLEMIKQKISTKTSELHKLII